MPGEVTALPRLEMQRVKQQRSTRKGSNVRGSHCWHEGRTAKSICLRSDQKKSHVSYILGLYVSHEVLLHCPLEAQASAVLFSFQKGSLCTQIRSPSTGNSVQFSPCHKFAAVFAAVCGRLLWCDSSPTFLHLQLIPSSALSS